LTSARQILEIGPAGVTAAPGDRVSFRIVAMLVVADGY